MATAKTARPSVPRKMLQVDKPLPDGVTRQRGELLNPTDYRVQLINQLEAQHGWHTVDTREFDEPIVTCGDGRLFISEQAAAQCCGTVLDAKGEPVPNAFGGPAPARPEREELIPGLPPIMIPKDIEAGDEPG